MNTVDQTVKAANLRADNAELLLKDPALLANHLCKDLNSTEAFLYAFSKAQVGENLI